MVRKLAIIAAFCVFAGPALSATCHVSEYRELVVDDAGRVVPVAAEPTIGARVITYTTQATIELTPGIRFIRLVCTAKAHYEFGPAPFAKSTSPYVPADAPEYFGIRQGLNYAIKLSVYDGTS